MFTVKQLARLAGLTPRTLRFYDQIGLLKPSRVGDNGYRYYGEEALLRLQQILLYREMGMPLERIQALLQPGVYDPLAALEGHRQELEDRIRHYQRLIETVDATILHLKGKKAMNQSELFKGFSEEEQAEMEKEAMQLYDPETVKQSNLKWKGYSAAEKERIMEEGSAVYRDFIAAIPKGAGSAEAQACVQRWRDHMAYFWVPAEDQLMALAEMYGVEPRFAANFAKMHPQLADFVRDAVRIYLEKRKS